ncbi:thiamine phosphate synthase [Pseudorhodoplanes sp.]|uniref:thiamine phosphate synthase n=1 Tax=Pseudorhodoplanes sp. TaxID=1934341 RepID=UPI002CCD5D01|nr:thiamine phosphate synthase [Pseudorhodoplanes sp.]HWV54599.1 thiamine phosphate synthase [Pseudorhodoplanes sp.]
MTSPRPHDDDRPDPRLYLVTPAAADPQALKFGLMTAFDSADVAAVLMRLPADDDRALINRVKAIAPTVQNADVALLIDGYPQIVARAGADGAHLTGIASFESAVGSLKPDRIAGVGGLETRHDAMTAAEGGADYVMFGDNARPSLEALIERVSWWSEVFEIPCVAYATALDEIAPLVAAGADFVAVGDAVFADPRGLEAALKDAQSRLVLPETAV